MRNCLCSLSPESLSVFRYYSAGDPKSPAELSIPPSPLFYNTNLNFSQHQNIPVLDFLLLLFAKDFYPFVFNDNRSPDHDKPQFFTYSASSYTKFSTYL